MRRPLPILLLLLAGAVVNVGVASGLWWGWPRSCGTTERLPLFEAEEVFRRYGDGGDVEVAGLKVTTVGYTERDVVSTVLGSWDVYSHLSWDLLMEERRIGWPARCLGGAVTSRESGGTVIEEWMWILGTDRIPFPYGPLWPGFALNTLFYAALLWLLFLFAPRQTRRLIRARRGLCPACAYPVGESVVCSECWEGGEEPALGDDLDGLLMTPRAGCR